MRLSMAHSSGAGNGRADVAPELFSAVWRRVTLFITAVLILACVGILISPAKKAGASTTVFASGQVFASVGFSNVGVYDPSSGNLLNTLTDDTNEQFTTGSAFDANGNFYVTDDYSGDVSEFSPDGTPLGQFATGLTNPLSLVFDNQGDLYVGQQTTPYIAEFSPTGQRLPDIGPLATELYGDDWIDLASDQCTLYYTSEGTDIERYNKCTNTQESNFNAAPLAGSAAYEVRILADGDVLVADSTAVYMLDENGNVIQSYSCDSMPGCQGQLFAVAVDPSGTSFWTGDSFSGNIWQINLATGAVMQTINSGSGFLFGLSVDDELTVATSPVTVAATPTTLTLNPVSSDFSSPTPVSGILTDSTTGTPVPDEPVTFTLNGSESCTATTDANGDASCVITPSEPSSSYTLTASFPGDTTTTTPIGSDSSSSTFTVNPDNSTLTYTGPTAAVNGQPVTLTANLTTDTPSADTPLPTKVVTISVGTGLEHADLQQHVRGRRERLLHRRRGEPTERHRTHRRHLHRRLLRHPFERDQHPDGDRAHVAHRGLDQWVLRLADHDLGGPDRLQHRPAGVRRAGRLHRRYPDLHRTDGLDRHRLVHHHAHRSLGRLHRHGQLHRRFEPAGAAHREHEHGHPYGDPGQYHPDLHRPTSTTNGQPITLSGNLTTNGTPLSGQPVTLALGSGGSPQTCSGTTDSAGNVSCSIAAVSQPVGPTPVTATYAGNTYYAGSTVTGSVQVGPVQVSTTLTVAPVTRHLRQPRHRVGHPGQQLHQYPGVGRDGDPQAERDPVLLRPDERLGRRLVHHHADRARRDLHPGGLVRRRHPHGAHPAGQHRAPTPSPRRRRLPP